MGAQSRLPYLLSIILPTAVLYGCGGGIVASTDRDGANGSCELKFDGVSRKHSPQSRKTFAERHAFGQHHGKVDFVGKAKALGYQIILVMIHLESPGLNKARVAQRVEEGGHDVPDEKIETRIPRLLRLIKSVIPLCDYVYLLDNSRADNPFIRVVTIH